MDDDPGVGSLSVLRTVLTTFLLVSVTHQALDGGALVSCVFSISVGHLGAATCFGWVSTHSTDLLPADAFPVWAAVARAAVLSASR